MTKTVDQSTTRLHRTVVQELRRDTGEVLTTRVMSDAERQQVLPMEAV